MMWTICVLGILFVAGVNGQACPHGFEQHGNSCYLFSHGKETWTGAVESCKEFSADAYLVEIDSDAENDFVGARSVSDQVYYWIGLNDKLVEGEYVWIHSGNLLSGNGYWGMNEPDAAYDKNCVYYYYEESLGKWSDTHCTNKQGYVCEMDLTNIAVG